MRVGSILDQLADAILGIPARCSSRVVLGRRSYLRWRALRVPPGNRVEIGDGCHISATMRFETNQGTITIGDRSYIGRSTLICHSRIHVGNDVVMSWGVTVVDHNSHAISWDHRRNDVLDWRKGKKDWSGVKIAPITIGDRAWIGFNAIILKGVTIGDEAIVGAGSVVTRDVPPRTIVAGNPARVIRELKSDEC